MNIKIFFRKNGLNVTQNKAMLRNFCIHQQDNLNGILFVVFLIVVLIKAEYGSKIGTNTRI